MVEVKLTWRQLNSDYNLLYILGLLVTFSSFFTVQSELSVGSFGVVSLIFRFNILFGLVDQEDSTFPIMCLFISFIGNVLGSLFAASLANKLGRKYVVVIGCVIFICGTAMVRLSQDVPDINALSLVAHFLEGSASGLCTTIIPYICKADAVNETLPLESRGTFGVTAQFMYVVGVVATLSFSRITFEVSQPPYMKWWQYAYLLLMTLTIIIVAVIVSCYRGFDTKLWLWSKGRRSQAREVIRKIYRNPGSVPSEATFAHLEVSGINETNKPRWLGFSDV